MNPLPEPQDLDPVVMANMRARGKRPVFLQDPAVERVLSITMSIAAELSVTRERVDTLERVLVQRGLLKPDDVDSFLPDATAQATRHANGREYIARILRILEQDVQAMSSVEDPSVEQLVDELGLADSESGDSRCD